MAKIKSDFDRDWIIANSLEIIQQYSGLTLRALHYQLVGLGMTNDIKHYKKVVSAMTQARWDGIIAFDAFVDHERETLGQTKYEPTDVSTSVVTAKAQIRAWARSYSKNRWENQPIYPEVFIEKKALQGAFEETCREWDIALSPCKGYPSITFLNDSAIRFSHAVAEGKYPVILYFGDYDPSGEDIPRSIVESISKINGVKVDLRRIALNHDQVVDWKLPHAPTKEGDSRTKNWDGLGQVELDAIYPRIKGLLNGAIESVLQPDLYEELLQQEEEEKEEFRKILRDDFNSLI